VSPPGVSSTGASSESEAEAGVTEVVVVGWSGSDPEDKFGLFTAGDSAGEPPSVGDEELTEDLSREIGVQNESHPDTVRLERATAKGLPLRIEMARQKTLLSPE
jgi:hypothetical protein